MIDNRFNPWYYLVIITLGVFVGSLLGWPLHHPGIGGIAGAVLGVIGFLIVGGPAKPKGSAYSLALLAILGLPSWHWVVLALLAFAVLVAIALVVGDCIRFQRRLKGECGV